MVQKFETVGFGSVEAMPSQEKIQAEQEAPQEESVLSSLDDRSFDMAFDSQFDQMIVPEERMKVAEEEDFEGAFEEAFGGLEEKAAEGNKMNVLGVSKNYLKSLDDDKLMQVVLEHVGKLRAENNNYYYKMDDLMEDLKNRISNLKDEEKDSYRAELNDLKENLKKTDDYFKDRFAALDEELGIVDLRGMQMKFGKTEDEKSRIFSENFAKGNRDTNAEVLASFNKNKKLWNNEIDTLLEELDKGTGLEFAEDDIMSLLDNLDNMAQGASAQEGTVALSSEEMLDEGASQAKLEFIPAKGQEGEWMANQDMVQSFAGEDLAYLEKIYSRLNLMNVAGENPLEGIGDLSGEKVQGFLNENEYTMKEVEGALKNLGKILARYQEFDAESSKINVSDKRQLEILKKLSELK